MINEQLFDTADAQNQRGKQRFAAQMTAANRVEAQRKAVQLGRDRFGERRFHLETETVPGSALAMHFVVVSDDNDRVVVESPTWW